VRRAALLFVLACRSHEQPPPPPPPAPPPAPAIDRAALLEGKLPEGAPESSLIMGQCQICHNFEYLTQQRLTDAGWKKTIEKMRKFGAVLTDDQAATLVAFAVRYWNPDLPGRTWKAGPAPKGATPPLAAGK